MTMALVNVQAPAPRPAPLPGAVAARLDLALSLALAGARQSACEICAGLMHADLPLVAGDPACVRALIEVLLLADGGRLVARLIRALCGIEVELVGARAAPMSSGPVLLAASGGRTLVLALDTAALHRPGGARLARSWSDQIMRAVGASAAWPGKPEDAWPEGDRRIHGEATARRPG